MKQSEETKTEHSKTDDTKNKPTRKKRKGPIKIIRKSKSRFKSSGEVKEHADLIVTRANTLIKSADHIRILNFDMYHCDGPKVANKSSDEIEAYISKGIVGPHRSTVDRQLKAGKADHYLELPPGELSEYGHRTLRTRVKSNYHTTVLDEGLELKGSYKNIQSKDILKIATDKGHLKDGPEEPESDEEFDAGNGADSTDETWNDSAEQQEPTKKGKDDMASRIKTASRDLPAKLVPAFKAITNDQKNIGPVKQYLEICHRNHDLATHVNKLAIEDMWTLVGRLDLLK